MLRSGRARICLVVVLSGLASVRPSHLHERGTTEDAGAQTASTPRLDAAGGLRQPQEGLSASTPDWLGALRDSGAELVDVLDARQTVVLLPGLAAIERLPSASSNSSSEEGGTPGDVLDARLARYLATHVVDVRLPRGAQRLVERVLRRPDDVVSSQDQREQGRGRLRRLVLPLALLLNLKSLVLVPVFISAVMLVAFKGLWAGLAAFLVSGAIGLRQLFKGGGDDAAPSTRFTVGVVKPHIVPEVYHHGPAADYWHGWSRSGAPPHLPLPPVGGHDAYPYRGYYPPATTSWGDRPLVS